jgi:hypothetical protein
MAPEKGIRAGKPAASPTLPSTPPTTERLADISKITKKQLLVNKEK